MKNRFEYKVFRSHEDYISENLKKDYEDEWIEAGDAHVKYHDAPTRAAFIFIPMKRKIANKQIDTLKIFLFAFKLLGIVSLFAFLFTLVGII